MQIHVVQQGDTLWKIANRYGVQVKALAAANTLSDTNALVVGQSLVVPTPPGAHVVQPGESLKSIAGWHGVSLDRLLAANQLKADSQVNPGTKLIIPAVTRPEIDVNGYLRNMGQRGVDIINRDADDLTYITFFYYGIKPDGSLIPLDDAKVLDAARSHHILPLMTITNLGAPGGGEHFDPEGIRAILTNKNVQQKLFDNILDVLQKKQYAGINVDFENLKPGDREHYNEFLKYAVERLHKPTATHPQGYLVTSAVAPRYSSKPTGQSSDAHDYTAHGKILDFVVLMTYDWGWEGGPARAISPVDEMEKVVKYALTVIPKDKIMLGIGFYGRDWPLPFVQGKTRAKTFVAGKAFDSAIQFGSKIEFHPTSKAPYFHYKDAQGVMHEVWFEDARSLQAKYELVKKYDLRGVSYWSLDLRMPENHWVLHHNFRVRRRT